MQAEEVFRVLDLDASFAVDRGVTHSSPLMCGPVDAGVAGELLEMAAAAGKASPSAITVSNLPRADPTNTLG